MQKVSATDNISKAILEDKRCFAILKNEREASLTWSVLRTMEEDTSRRNDFSFGSPFDSYENEPEAEQWDALEAQVSKEARADGGTVGESTLKYWVAFNVAAKRKSQG